MNFKNFLSFERMITPVIIKILFYIGLAGSALSGIMIFISAVIGGIADGGFGAIIGGFFLGIIGGLIVAILGALGTRVYTELLILAFRINENLTDIKLLLEKE
jgi:hypothetical protein